MASTVVSSLGRPGAAGNCLERLGVAWAVSKQFGAAWGGLGWLRLARDGSERLETAWSGLEWPRAHGLCTIAHFTKGMALAVTSSVKNMALMVTQLSPYFVENMSLMVTILKPYFVENVALTVEALQRSSISFGLIRSASLHTLLKTWH